MAWTAAAQERKTAWPLSLADGLPKQLPGYAAAPTDPLPDTDENDMGVFTEVSRFFQQIESPTVTRQFRLVVQDYGKEKNLEPELRKAMAEASKAPSVETKEVKVAGRIAFAATDRSGPQPDHARDRHRPALPAGSRPGSQCRPGGGVEAARKRRLRSRRGN